MLNQIQQATVTFSSDGKEKVSFGANCRSIRFDKSGTENTLGQIKLRVCNANNFVTNYITPKEGMQINGIDFDACEVEGTGACGVILTVSTGSFSGGGGAGAALPKDATFDSVEARRYVTVGDPTAHGIQLSYDGIVVLGTTGTGSYMSDMLILCAPNGIDCSILTANNLKITAGTKTSIIEPIRYIIYDDNSGAEAGITAGAIFVGEAPNPPKYSIALDYFNLDGFTIFNTSASCGFSLTSKKFAGKFIGFRQTATSNTFQLNDKTFEMRLDTTTSPNRLVFEAV